MLHNREELQQTISVPKNETLDYFFIFFAENECIERKVVFSLADGAEVHARGVIIGSGESEVTLTTEVHHQGKQTRGYMTIKGVFADRARAHVTGWIKIPENGNNADAFLEQRFLLLSKNARAKAEPMLEILANDVKASHAATVSRIDDEQLFYLASRGIDTVEGRRLLTAAFINEILSTIPSRDVVRSCQKEITKILNLKS